jgi:hypothetical protein
MALIRAPLDPASGSPDIRGTGGQVRKHKGRNRTEKHEDRREEIRNWPEWWPSGQVGTGNAESDASYVL